MIPVSSPSVATRNRAAAKRRYGAIALSLVAAIFVTAGMISWQPIHVGLSGKEALSTQENESVPPIQSDSSRILTDEGLTIYLVDSRRQAIALRHSLPEFTDLPRGSVLVVSSPEEAMLAEWYLAQGDDGIQIVDLRGAQNSYDSVPAYLR